LLLKNSTDSLGSVYSWRTLTGVKLNNSNSIL